MKMKNLLGTSNQWAPSHNMFTRPQEKDLSLLDSDPGKVKSYQHDLVLNGIEIGGGAMRIHRSDIQEKIFSLIGFKENKRNNLNIF